MGTPKPQLKPTIKLKGIFKPKLKRVEMRGATEVDDEESTERPRAPTRSGLHRAGVRAEDGLESPPASPQVSGWRVHCYDSLPHCYC